MSEPLDLDEIKDALWSAFAGQYNGDFERHLDALIAEVERLREAVLAVDECGFVAKMLDPADQVERYTQVGDYWTQVQQRIVY